MLFTKGIIFAFKEYIYFVADLTARLSWINWENLGVNPNRRSVLTSLALTSDSLNP